MGDDIDYEPYFTINAWQPTWVYSPIQRYNELCSTEITAEQYTGIQKILKREKRKEEKQKAIKEFHELTRVLEKCYR